MSTEEESQFLLMKIEAGMSRYEDERCELVPPIRIERTTNGSGNRFHDPTPAYSDSLRPSLAKSYGKSQLWLE